MIDAFRANLTDSEEDYSALTVKAYLRHLQHFAKWFETTNGQPLSKTNLTQIDAREYRQHLMTNGRAPATVNAHLAAVKAFAAWCGITLLVKSVEQQQLAPRWLNKLQQAAMLREAERATHSNKVVAQRDYRIIVLLLNTGLRVDELISLQPGDVTTSPRSGTLLVRSGKGSKQRSVPLNKEARRVLTDLTLPLGISDSQVQRVIKEIGRRAAIECTPHTLRHTFAHNLASANVPADRIAALAGHASLNTTRRYTLPGEAELQNAVEALE